VSDARRIRILVADDHAIVREGLRALIEDRPDMELLGEAADGVEALSMTVALQPDLLLLDLMMPRMDGIAVIQELRSRGQSTRILVLTSYTDDDKVFAAIKAGALGYLLKDSSPQELLKAIRTVAQGESSLTPSIALKVIQELNRPSPLPPTTDPLTERELVVLKYVAQGLSNQEIAGRLTISERTAGSHVSNILDKLHLANRTQAALYALRSGIADLNESS
jgi:two-component system, NarL family, response regulator LiaR